LPHWGAQDIRWAPATASAGGCWHTPLATTLPQALLYTRCARPVLEGLDRCACTGSPTAYMTLRASGAFPFQNGNRAQRAVLSRDCMPTWCHTSVIDIAIGPHVRSRAAIVGRLDGSRCSMLSTDLRSHSMLRTGLKPKHDHEHWCTHARTAAQQATSSFERAIWTQRGASTS
jgi:hypothetical protein